MFTKLTIDLSANYESSIIYHGQTVRHTADEFVVNMVWSGAVANCGTIEVIAVFDEAETNAWDVVATQSISAITGRETVFSGVDCLGIKIKYTKLLTNTGTATIFVKTSD